MESTVENGDKGVNLFNSIGRWQGVLVIVMVFVLATIVAAVVDGITATILGSLLGIIGGVICLKIGQRYW